MQSKIILHANIVTPAGIIEDGFIQIQNGKIQAVGKMDELQISSDALGMDAGGRTVTAGFIDAHCHGGDGFDYLNCTQDEAAQILQWLPSTGITGALATLSSASLEEQVQAIEKLLPLVGKKGLGAQLLGIHLEGPYLNKERLGAQLASVIRLPSTAEMECLLDMGKGAIRLLTLAPELPGALDVIRLLTSRGVVTSCGHTEATYEQFNAAVDAGLTRMTHTFNGMPSLNHRKPGALGAALVHPAVFCELIMDGFHVHSAVAKMLIRLKGDHAILVTDATQAAGLQDGIYIRPGNRKIIVKDGSARLESGTLAGSVLTMSKAVINTVQMLDLPLEQAVRMCSQYEAASLGFSAQKGTIEVGKDADIVILQQDFSIAETLVAGEAVYRAHSFEQELSFKEIIH